MYTYRHFNESSVELFKEWVVLHDWRNVLEAGTADEKADAYQTDVVNAIERFFSPQEGSKKEYGPAVDE